MPKHSFSTVLTPHPDSPAPEVRQLRVSGERHPLTLSLCYTLVGEWADFVFPDKNHPAPANKLWQRSCCELFWREADSIAYREYNFSPSGQWAAYAFSAYRKLENILPPPPQEMEWTVNESGLILQVEVPVCEKPLQLGLAVILQRRSGEIVYHALRHPSGAPDFHHPDNFALYLP